MNLPRFMILVSLLLLLSSSQNTTCDYQLILVSSAMGSFTTNAYQTPILDKIFSLLNSLRATVLATYQLCFNKSIIDPDSIYPQDISQCLMGLYNTSLLSAQYTGQYTKIKADTDKIAKIVFSTQNNCRPVLNYKGWTNISDECKSGAKDLDDILIKYGNDIILGKNGTNYIPDMLLAVQKQRKQCGFNILTKPKRWNGDNCQQANINWLYPVTDQIDTALQNQNYLNYTAYFYNLYQSVYRAYALCNSNYQTLEDPRQIHDSTLETNLKPLSLKRQIIGNKKIKEIAETKPQTVQNEYKWKQAIDG